MENNKITGILSIGLAAIMWGFDGVVLTPRLLNLNPVFVVFASHAIPFLILLPFFTSQLQFVKRFSISDAFLLFAIAFTGGSLGTLAIVKALFLVNFNHLSIVVLLQKLQPIFALLLASVLLKEKLSTRFYAWAMVAIAAGYTLTFGWQLPHIVKNENLFYAMLYAILAAFCFGSSTVLSKMALQRFPFKTVTFYRYGFTVIIMAIGVSLFELWNQIAIATNVNWIFFIIIGLTTGSGAIYLYYFGLNNVRASVSTIIELAFPISAIIFDYLFNKNTLSLVQWLSAGIMILAILQISKNNSKK